VSEGDGRLQAPTNRLLRGCTNRGRWSKHGNVSWRHLSLLSRWPRWLLSRRSLSPRTRPRCPRRAPHSDLTATDDKLRSATEVL